MSPIVGYLLAGIVIGPNSPGFTADSAIANQFAEVGIVLLMFGVGLHFDLDELDARASHRATGCAVAMRTFDSHGHAAVCLV